jgi:Flp pilus assembly protein CpaB
MSGPTPREFLVCNAKTTPTGAATWRRGLILGGLGIYMAFCASPPTSSPEPAKLATEKQTADVPAAIPQVTLLVARKSLNILAPIGDQPDALFVEKQFTKDEAPKDAFGPADLSKLKDKFVKRLLQPGDHVTADDFIDNNHGIQPLAPGMQAVAVPTIPGSFSSGIKWMSLTYCDIYVTKRVGKEIVAEMLLEMVLVLDGTDLGLDGNRSCIATVALCPEDALRVRSALEAGYLFHIVLSRLDDRPIEKAKGSQKGSGAD